MDLRRAEAEARIVAEGETDPFRIESLVDEDEVVEEAAELFELRTQQKEDWVAFALFMLFLGGADAFVAAHLADFPEPLEAEIRALPDMGAELEVRAALRSVSTLALPLEEPGRLSLLKHQVAPVRDPVAGIHVVASGLDLREDGEYGCGPAPRGRVPDRPRACLGPTRRERRIGCAAAPWELPFGARSSTRARPRPPPRLGEASRRTSRGGGCGAPCGGSGSRDLRVRARLRGRGTCGSPRGSSATGSLRNVTPISSVRNDPPHQSWLPPMRVTGTPPSTMRARALSTRACPRGTADRYSNQKSKRSPLMTSSDATSPVWSSQRRNASSVSGGTTPRWMSLARWTGRGGMGNRK